MSRILSLIAIGILSNVAIAAPRPTEYSQINRVVLDPSLRKVHPQAMFATVKVDYEQKLITLYLKNGRTTGWGPGYVPGSIVRTFEAPIVNEWSENRSDGCNVRIIDAYVDERPFDGDMTQITVMDYSDVRPGCVQKFNGTYVKIETVSSGAFSSPVRTLSSYYGTRLYPLYGNR